MERDGMIHGVASRCCTHSDTMSQRREHNSNCCASSTDATHEMGLPIIALHNSIAIPPPPWFCDDP
jgi:hypothetical protein